MSKQKRIKKKIDSKKIIDVKLILIGLLLTGILYWDNKDILFSLKFTFFVIGTYIIIWFLVYLYLLLKENNFQIKILKNIDKEFFLAFIGSIVVYFFVSKYLLYWGIGSTIIISISLLLIDILRNLNKKQ